MNYVGTVLKNTVDIKKIYTIHYFEFANDYYFTGEQHDFWECVYVDGGEIIVSAGEKRFPLSRGNMVFHKPGEWHGICMDGKSIASVAVITFECHSKCMEFFEDRILSVGQEQKELISKIIDEYGNAFSTPLNDVYTNQLTRKKTCPIGTEQLLRMHLCELLISFMRAGQEQKQETSMSLRQSEQVFELLTDYMKEHLNQKLTVGELTEYVRINRTSIAKLFQKRVGMGPVEYFITMKIERAKELLRKNTYNITQISELLGYANIHYFSRQFKQVTGMSPLEYSKSIRSLNYKEFNKEGKISGVHGEGAAE